METNNHQIVDYDVVLDAKFGKEGSPERAKAEDDAYEIANVRFTSSEKYKKIILNIEIRH